MMTKADVKRLALRSAAELIECAIASGEEWLERSGSGAELDETDQEALLSALIELAQILRKQGERR
jgi:hypothetical protein